MVVNFRVNHAPSRPKEMQGYGTPAKEFLKETPPGLSAALFKKFCKRDFCDEVRDFKIPEPEAVAS